jgi:guanylate kinase
VVTNKQSPLPGSIFILSAPSGAGKSTLVKRLLAAYPELHFSVSYTTRPARQGEVNGREYYFVSATRFKRMVAAKKFVEWASVHGHYYGTTVEEVSCALARGEDLLLDIDVEGHRQVRRRIRNAVSIFILPPSYAVLERRLRQRGSDSEAGIERRLTGARQELMHWDEYDYLIVNNRLAQATRDLLAVVRAGKCRREVQTRVVRSVIKTFGG